jgi:hypothetical protein
MIGGRRFVTRDSRKVRRATFPRGTDRRAFHRSLEAKRCLWVAASAATSAGPKKRALAPDA